MPEPDWEGALRATVYDWVSGGVIVREGAYRALRLHIDAAYQRGLMAGRSQSNYPARRKKKEDSCTATAGGPTPASSTDEP